MDKIKFINTSCRICLEVTMVCQHFKNARCMLDPKYHKPTQAEITGFCEAENNYDCPIINKYSGLECMSC
jgi:hypothetical protein